jgi:hypothetical protein
MFADEYPSARDEVLEFLETRKERTAKPNILRFLGKIRPKSCLLLEYCLKALHIGEDDDCSGEIAIVAAKLLGKHFGGDYDVLARILSEREKKYTYKNMLLPYIKIWIPLCEGWPENEELDNIFKLINKQKQLYEVYFVLICQKSSSKTVFSVLKNLLSSSPPRHRWYSRDITRHFLRRLQKDDILLKMLMECLENNPTPSEKATFPRLIGVARGISPELRTWCIREADHQLSGAESLEIGYDLIISEPRPVVYSLLEVLDQSS